MSREIEVWADWHELGSPTLMGRLRSCRPEERKFFPSPTRANGWQVVQRDNSILICDSLVVPNI